MINLEFIKCIVEVCSENISERVIHNLFLKGKTIFSKNDGVQGEICWDRGRNTPP